MSKRFLRKKKVDVESSIQFHSDRIVGSYDNDLNILEIDKHILNHLQNEKLINHLLEQIKEQQFLMSHPQNGIDRRFGEKKIEDLRLEIEKCLDSSRQQRYQDQVREILEDYNRIGPSLRKVHFGKKKSTSSDETDNFYRMSIISRYLEIAREYIIIDLIQRNTMTKKCFSCNFLIDKCEDLYCPNCGLERNRTMVSTVSEVRKDYEDKENFYKAFLRFQGRQNNSIPESLFRDLDNYFDSYGKPKGREIRALPLDKDGLKKGTDHQLLWRALGKTGNNKYYEDANLIGHLYWGWLLPDAHYLEEIIMKDYDATQEFYLQDIEPGQSSMNTQFRLFKSLQARDFPCKKSQFRIVKTRDILENCERRWKKMALGAGLPYIPTI